MKGFLFTSWWGAFLSKRKKAGSFQVMRAVLGQETKEQTFAKRNAKDGIKTLIITGMPLVRPDKDFLKTTTT